MQTQTITPRAWDKTQILCYGNWIKMAELCGSNVIEQLYTGVLSKSKGFNMTESHVNGGVHWTKEQKVLIRNSSPTPMIIAHYDHSQFIL